MKVLIVDDQKTNRQILAWILEELGHDYVEAENGKQAVEKVLSDSPDLILMDVIMPVMDGYDATKEIKSLLGDQYIPVIFLTGLSDEKTLIKCLESGGDDFLSKPVDEIVLQAKMKAHSRTRDLNEQVRKKNDELVYLHHRLQEEHAMGEHVLTNAMNDGFLDSPNISHFISPASLFNGDVLLAAPKPSGGLYVFLGDFTGHGLAASIGAIPVSQAFYAMTSKDLPLTEIVSTLNGSLCRFLPDYMFCAAVLVELNQAADMAKIWSGGLPDGLVINSDLGVKGEITSQHMPLGILEGDEFEDDLELIKLAEGDSLFFYTDGITEGVSDEGVMFGEERLKVLLNAHTDKPLEQLIEGFHKFKVGTEQEDDVSVVQIKALPISADTSSVELEEDLLPWTVSMKLTSSELKSLTDPVSQLFLMFPKNRKLKIHNDVVRSIVAEMFSNSLEHGLLGLDSSLKETDDGFLTYYEQREVKLALLDSGEILVKLEYQPLKDKNTLNIQISDSGAGFDVEKAKAVINESTDDLSYGRGLKLVGSLAKGVNFSNGGSTIDVSYDLTTL